MSMPEAPSSALKNCVLGFIKRRREAHVDEGCTLTGSRQRTARLQMLTPKQGSRGPRLVLEQHGPCQSFSPRWAFQCLLRTKLQQQVCL